MVIDEIAKQYLTFMEIGIDSFVKNLEIGIDSFADKREGANSVQAINNSLKELYLQIRLD
jgi:hypothetical protein